MRNLIFVLIFLLTSVMPSAQNLERTYLGYQLENNTLHIKVSDGDYYIQFYKQHIIENTFVPSGENYKPQSHAVVLEPSNVSTKVIEKQKHLEFSNGLLTLQVNFSPFQLVYYKDKELIISEKRGYFKSAHEPMEMVKDNIIAKETHKIEFNLSPDEVLFGAGARALGMNRRGYRLPLFNRAHYGYEEHSQLMNYTMPIVVSGNQYLIHFDNPTNGYLDLDSKKDNTLTYESIAGPQTYQIVVGHHWEDMVSNYTTLTGKQPMLPRWALGNFSSRFGYHSQEEVVQTVELFREENIPVDAVILDLYWFGKEVTGTMGNLQFDIDSFPQPKKMIADLDKLNTETILITEPFILTTSNRWQEAVKKDVLAKDSLGRPYAFDFFFGNTGLVDIYANQGYQWFKQIYKDLIGMGIHGMWGDLGEPEVHPHNILHATGNGQEVHNIYGHDWAKLVQQAYHETNPKLRPFILMRAGYSGSQRYGIVPWSGDVNRTWGGLQKQQEISLQMGLQGIAWMHSDLGGFAGARLDEELYQRWLQYGVFQPIYRPHAQEEVPSEPVFRSEETKAITKKAIDLRYQLLPYNYHLMFLNHKEGTPLMKPLFFEEPNNLKLLSYDDAYLWGDNFLVAPVKKAGQEELEVYLPSSSDWVDFYTQKVYKGGANYTLDLNPEYIPTFVRSGSIIPMAKPMQSTREYNGNQIELHCYVDKALGLQDTQIYNDDGQTRLAYENKAFELLKVSSKKHKNSLSINLSAEVGDNYNHQNKEITLVFYQLNKVPQSLAIGSKSFPVAWSNKSKVLKVILDWNTAENKTVTIKF